MSQADVEHFTELVGRTRNVANNRGRLIKKATRFLKPRERRQREEEKKQIDGIFSQPPWALKELTETARQRLAQRRNSLEDDLAENSPPPVPGDVRDKLAERLKQLTEEIRVGMPTREVVRRNPPGAVGMHERWEKANKDKIIERKNILKLLDPDNEDPDYLNVEMIRPSGITQDMAATFMMGATVPGHFAMSPLAKANWPSGMPELGTVDNPFKQAERQEIAEDMVKAGEIQPNQIEEMKEQIKILQAQLAAKETPKAKVKAKVHAKPLTEEQKEKMRIGREKYWAEKRAKEAQHAA